MSVSEADVLRRVLVQIATQRQNLYPGGSRQDNADRYHEQLDRLAALGFDVDEFRLDPERDMFYRSAGSNPHEGQKYQNTRSVRLGVLEAKMEAILSYFDLDTGKAPIGFAAPRKAISPHD